MTRTPIFLQPDLYLELLGCQVNVVRRALDELLMRAFVDDLSVVKRDDPIGMPDCRQPVSNDNSCFVNEHLSQRLLDQLLGIGIKRRGGFIENEHRRIFENGAGKAKTLLFPALQPGCPRRYLIDSFHPADILLM